MEAEGLVEFLGAGVGGGDFEGECDGLHGAGGFEVGEEYFGDALAAVIGEDEEFIDDEDSAAEFVAPVGDEDGVSDGGCRLCEEDDLAGGGAGEEGFDGAVEVGLADGVRGGVLGIEGGHHGCDGGGVADVR